MKGDFTRFPLTEPPNVSRVLKQQGRVDLDADWNDFAEILARQTATERIDVIGRCGAPEDAAGFGLGVDGGALTLSPGRLYVDGILCTLPGTAPIPLDAQPDLPGYAPPEEDGVYLAYVDVWERHVTYLEAPEIREVALGGPDTTTRLQVVVSVRLHPLGDGNIEDFACQPFPADANTGRLAARAEPSEEPSSPCAVPASAGYRGLENRLYRVEIHDAGRDADGNQVRTPTFKWSRDNGSVALGVASVDAADRLTLTGLGPDAVLTVHPEDWVELAGDATDLAGGAGTLARVLDLDPDALEVDLAEIQGGGDLSVHGGEAHLKLRRWDHRATPDVALEGGALPIQGDWFELENGVQVRFDTDARYDVGDYWVIPARTREGAVHWPREGGDPAELPRLGVTHHYCTLALVRRNGGVWEEPRDCRSLFPPLTEIGEGGCCVPVLPGEDIQRAVDAAVAAGGGSVCLCAGVHRHRGPLVIADARNLSLHGEGPATLLRLEPDEAGRGGLQVTAAERLEVSSLALIAEELPALADLGPNADADPNRTVAFRDLLLVNLAGGDGRSSLPAALRLAAARGVSVSGCRMIAESGLVAVPAPAPAGDGGGAGGGAQIDPVQVRFEALDVGDTLASGDSVVTEGVTLTGERFFWTSGEGTDEGFAEVDNEGLGGGSGQDMHLNNLNLAVALDNEWSHASIAFGRSGGNVNLRVNSVLRNADSFAALDGALIGGVRVRIFAAPDGDGLGQIRLSAETAPISDFAIGGQELWVDNIVFRGPVAAPAPPEAPGEGVSDLRLEASRIRYAEFGTVASSAIGWELDGCDIGPWGGRLRDALAAALPDADAGLAAHAAFLAAVEDGLAVKSPADGPAPDLSRGVAVAAALWQGGGMRESRLAGRHGVLALVWIGSTLADCTVDGGESGLGIGLAAAADWRDSRVSASGGPGIAFAACTDLGIRSVRLRAEAGIVTLSAGRALALAALLVGAVTRARGTAGIEATRAALRALLAEAIARTGLGDVAQAVEAWVAQNVGTERTALDIVADRLADALARGTAPENLANPVLNLSVSGCEIDAGIEGIGLHDLVATARLAIVDCRIDTPAGQALRLAAHPVAASPALAIRLARRLLETVAARLDGAAADGDPERAAVASALAARLGTWAEAADRFFAPDIRIAGNSLRSHRTAIETTLFETVIENNRILMVPRAAAEAAEDGAIFGRVRDAAGAPIGQASVGLRGASGPEAGSEADTTDDAGRYRFDGLAAGAYRLGAVAPGRISQLAQVDLAASEAVELDFTLAAWQITTAIAAPTGAPLFAATVRARRLRVAPVGNDRLRSIVELLERSPAFEPLAAALRDGDAADPALLARSLRVPGGPLATQAQRTEAAASVTGVGGLLADAGSARRARALAEALRAGSEDAAARLLPRFAAALLALVDSRGILAAGPGCRIADNAVRVPAGQRAEDDAIGGIQISVSRATLTRPLAMARALIAAVAGTDIAEAAAIADPMLGMTETLIAANEISGGAGHGIAVLGLAGLPDQLADLTVRGNQIREMGGAGIYTNAHAFLVGLTVSDNLVAECGRPIGLARDKGGILLRSAAICAVEGNRVERCGRAAPGFGIGLDTVYGARVTGNTVLACGSGALPAESGGVQLAEVYGAASVSGNSLAFNAGRGLSWANAARDADAALLPQMLIDLANARLGAGLAADGLADEADAAITSNQLKSGDVAIPLVSVLNLRNLSFVANTCRAGAPDMPLGELQGIAFGTIGQNRMTTASGTTLSVKKLEAGSIVGNVGNASIELKAPGADVETGLNAPAV